MKASNILVAACAVLIALSDCPVAQAELAFSPLQTFEFGGGYSAYALGARFDADAYADLLAWTIGIDGSTHLVLRRGTAQGLSNSSQQIALAGRPRATPVVGDLDGDGDLDLVVSVWSTVGTQPRINILINDGTAHFGAPLVSGADGVYTEVIAMADLDSDLRPDLIGLQRIVGGMVWWRNLGGNNFTGPTPIASIVPGQRILVADLDGDGVQDLVNFSPTSHAGAVSGHVFRGNGDGTFAAGVPLPTTSGTANDLGLGDLDGDGDADLAIATSTGTDLYRNDVGSFVNTGAVAAGGVRMTDVDGDGNVDLVGGAGITGFGVQLGTGAFAFDAEVRFDAGYVPLRLDTADIDGDGDDEVIASGYEIHVLRALSVAANTAPVASDQTFRAVSGTTLHFEPEVSDAEGHLLDYSWTVIAPPEHGSLYVPTVGFNYAATQVAGTIDEYAFTASDDRGGSTSFTVRIETVAAQGGGGAVDLLLLLALMGTTATKRRRRWAAHTS